MESLVYSSSETQPGIQTGDFFSGIHLIGLYLLRTLGTGLGTHLDTAV